MDRRLVVTVAVVAVVSLAGCSALPVFDGPGATPTTTPIADTPTPDGTPTATAEPLEYPDGYGASGVVDPVAASLTHERTLAGYDSFRFRFDVGVGNESGPTDAFVYLLRVDHTDEQALEIRDDGDIARYQYFESDRLYVKLEVEDDVSYNSTDLQYVRERFSGTEFLTPLFEHVDYGGPDIRRTDNGSFYRYRSEEVTNASAAIPAGVTNEGIESFNVTLVVHEDGSVRAVSYTVVTEQDTRLTALATVEGINSTSVERPDWYDAAADR
jgi:hypothetical protein